MNRILYLAAAFVGVTVIAFAILVALEETIG
jgi:hypothetical protein